VGNDYIFFSVNRGAKGTSPNCNPAVGSGCIMSYNVNSTTGTPSLVGTPLNVTTPGTNGCWATGGLVIDNGLTATTGNAQVYFIGLGGNDAGGPTGTTQTSTNCTVGTAGTIGATQASQINP
jgi:hypothetical protein